MTLPTGGGVASSPTLGADGTLYVGTDRRTVLVVAPTGEVVRELQTEGPVRGAVAATPTGDVLVPSEDGSIYAFDAHGALLWKTKTTSAIDSSRAFGRDHTIYFGAFDRALHAVDSGGHEKWTFKTGGPVNSSPAVADDGTVFFGSEDKEALRCAPLEDEDDVRHRLVARLRPRSHHLLRRV
jgi:outer membrane protein assembly factor BamB